MINSYLRKIVFTSVVVLLSFLSLSLFFDYSGTLAQTTPPFIREARVIEMDETGIHNPAGLAYSPRGNGFHVMDGLKRGQANTDLIRLTPFANLAGSARIVAAIQDPRNMVFDAHLNRLLIYQSPAGILIEVPENPDGSLNPRGLVRHNARHFGVQNPQGLTIDPVSGHLYFLDAAGPRLVRVEPEADGTVDNAIISTVDLQSTGLADVRGIAFDPITNNLHLIAKQKLNELTQLGQVVAIRDLAEFGIRDPQGMVFAPSGDLTDDPSEISLYITDQGDTAAPTTGRIVELSLNEVISPAAALTDGTLIRVIDTSRFSPPSPDPSGLAFLPASGTLLICDGEVDEMSQYFTGDNLFEISPSGSLLNTLTTLPFSDEPAGADINPANGHLFFGDDTGTRTVYEVNQGPDGVYNTADDRITSFKTGVFGSMDPEGLAYDTNTGALFIVDGVNREVYRVAPGANGIFDGVPSAGDDQVTHFDTLGFGLDDPEGGAYSSTTGTLYLVGKPAGTLFEVTTGGSLVRTINISALNARKPAGLALGLSSVDPANTSIYIAARGVDNDSNPDENDGKVYEVALNLPSGLPTNTPTVTPTPTNTSTNTPTPTGTQAAGPSSTPTNTPTPTSTPNVSSLTLQAVADARVRADFPNNNYGTTTRLDVDSGDQSYIRFTVSGVTGSVQSAKLRLFATNGSSNGPSLYLTSNSWTETGITWNNRPAPAGGAVANIGSVTSGTWIEFDLTGVIVGNGTYDFVLLPDSTDGVTFYSREGSSPPQLVLTIQ